MTTKNLDLNAMGLASLNEAEMDSINGGKGGGFFWGLVADNIDTIWQGLKEGLNAGYNSSHAQPVCIPVHP